MTKAVCVKVANIAYEDLKQWMKDPNNIYTGRRGTIFIHKNGTKTIFITKQASCNIYTLKDYSLEDY